LGTFWLHVCSLSFFLSSFFLCSIIHYASFYLKRRTSKAAEFKSIKFPKYHSSPHHNSVVETMSIPRSVSWVSFEETPRSRLVHIVSKPNDPEVAAATSELSDYLTMEHDVRVILNSPDNLSSLQEQVDIIITLGGDGTVLYVAHLYPQACPPIVAFHMGSLGFLAPFAFDEYKAILDPIFDSHPPKTILPVQLRMRLQVTVASGEVYTALNEVVVDRGVCSYLTNLDCFVDDEFVTTIAADGLILATPTGSTAYSLSAGGSMVHPNVPAILLTPICAHSLSFRPLILPDAAVVTLRVPEDSRGTAWASVDGRNRTEVKRGEVIRIQSSPWPLPSLIRADDRQRRRSSWFRDLAECLHWNIRDKQKPL
jgi:NAD kinase